MKIGACRVMCVGLACVGVLASCCSPAPPDPGPFLRVAGYYEDTSRDVAALWEQDLGTGGVPELTKLFDTGNARALSVYVSASDVYVAGYTTDSAGNHQAASLWKNGARTDLYSDLVGTDYAGASSVYVSGSDVYVAGYIVEGGPKKAGYWKNGVWQLLYDTTAAEATDIVVSDGVVYVSGFVSETGKANACYWKGSVRTDLYTDDYSAGYAIAVSGSGVYVAGYYLESEVLNAVYWKNGVLVPLASGGAKAYDVAVSGSDVYVAGCYTNAFFKSVACYWKNAAAGLVNLYNTDVNSAQANGIFVEGSDVYVAGWVNEGVQNACYWKNDARMSLSTDTSTAFSIVVAD